MAINFNRILRENSKKSKLVVTNMPLVRICMLLWFIILTSTLFLEQISRMSANDAIVYIDTVCQDIEPVMF